MEIIYKTKDFPDPGDRDVYNGIQEINKNNYQGALKYFEKASNYENEYASLFTAIFHFTGSGLNKRDPKKAVTLLQKVASNWNNSVAQYLLGDIFFRGDDGIPPNHSSGLHWLSVAANNEWADTYFVLFKIHWQGINIQKDHKKAISYLEKVAKIGKNMNTSEYDSSLYLFGNKDFKMSFTRDYIEIIKELNPSCRAAGDSLVDWMCAPNKSEIKQRLVWGELTNIKPKNITLSQLCLAQIYASDDNNVPKDGEKAMYLAKEAAKSQNSYAFTLVGQFYEEGIGTDQNYEEAMKCHKLSLELKEDSKSSFYIGMFYYLGKGVKKDHKLALNYFNLMISHKIEHGQSLHLIGNIFERGEDGVPLSYKKST